MCVRHLLARALIFYNNFYKKNISQLALRHDFGSDDRQSKCEKHMENLRFPYFCTCKRQILLGIIAIPIAVIMFLQGFEEIDGICRCQVLENILDVLASSEKLTF